MNSLALHEAGHAVVCIWLGVYVHEIGIGDDGGFVRSEANIPREIIPLIALSGAAAEGSPDGAADDFAALESFTIEERFKAWDLAKNMVVCHRPAIEALALELLRRRQMTGLEVWDFLNERDLLEGLSVARRRAMEPASCI